MAASTVSMGHATVDKALQAAYEKKWEDSISYYKKAAELYRKAMTETNERELQVSLLQMAEEQDRKVKEYTALFNVALQHQPSSSSPINVPKPTPSPSSSSPSSSSPSSSSPASPWGSPSPSPSPASSSSPFSTSPISLWGGVNQILDGIFGSSYLGGGGISPSVSPNPSTTSASPLDDMVGEKEEIEDDFVIVGSSSAPVIPHYPIPTVSTIFSGPGSASNTPTILADSMSAPPSLTEDFESDDEFLETLDRDLLIQEVKRLKGQVSNLMTLLSEQQDVKEENDVLKKSIIQFRREVQRNISVDNRPRHQSAVWNQKDQEEVVSLTESLLSLPKPKPKGSVSSSSSSSSPVPPPEQLQKENEELRAKLKEVQLKMAIQKREWESKRKKKG